MIRHARRREELPAVDVERVFPRVLAHRDVCSREPLYRRYDCGRARPHRAAARRRRCGRACAGSGFAPRGGARRCGQSALRTRSTRVCRRVAVLEAMRRVVAVGARPIGSHRLSELRQSAQARAVRRRSSPRSTAWRARHASSDLPFVSGNVSLYNESASRRRGAGIGDRRLHRVARRHRVRRHAGFEGSRNSALLWIGSRELSRGRFGAGRAARYRRPLAADLI